ncbi:hypothetical protein [Enterococcus pallens]|uniref:hypothetical protein n=1 Tax=Enterococcus pallens TaxID=160454 RepID=UPI0003A7DC32|nr:hypothetical protein [Enterococcus pallens]
MREPVQQLVPPIHNNQHPLPSDSRIKRFKNGFKINWIGNIIKDSPSQAKMFYKKEKLE